MRGRSKVTGWMRGIREEKDKSFNMRSNNGSEETGFNERKENRESRRGTSRKRGKNVRGRCKIKWKMRERSEGKVSAGKGGDMT